jgi:hypothetical protein
MELTTGSAWSFVDHHPSFACLSFCWLFLLHEVFSFHRAVSDLYLQHLYVIVEVNWSHKYKYVFIDFSINFRVFLGISTFKISWSMILPPNICVLTQYGGETYSLQYSGSNSSVPQSYSSSSTGAQSQYMSNMNGGQAQYQTSSGASQEQQYSNGPTRVPLPSTYNQGPVYQR